MGEFPVEIQNWQVGLYQKKGEGGDDKPIH